MRVYHDYNENGDTVIVETKNGRETRRSKDRKKALHKRDIWASVYGERLYMPVTGKFKKGKIHCSCRMCAFHEYPQQDRRTAERLQFELEDEVLDKVNGSIVNKLKKIETNNTRLKWGGVANAPSQKKSGDYEVFHELIAE